MVLSEQFLRGNVSSIGKIFINYALLKLMIWPLVEVLNWASWRIKVWQPVHFSSGSSSSHALPEQGLACTKWGQERPPFDAWCKITLWRSVNPPEPQRTEHCDHGPHSETLQSCTVKYNMNYLLMVKKVECTFARLTFLKTGGSQFESFISMISRERSLVIYLF